MHLAFLQGESKPGTVLPTCCLLPKETLTSVTLLGWFDLVWVHVLQEFLCYLCCLGTSAAGVPLLFVLSIAVVTDGHW
jgi:hypothetical protein